MDPEAHLVAMGFPRNKVKQALVASAGNVELAMDLLLTDNVSDDIMEIDDDSDDDPDLQLALKLQREEEKNREQSTLITCQLSGKKVKIDSLYIMDGCSHKFDRIALSNYVASKIQTQVVLNCPVSNCTTELSVRDMKELMPEKNSGLIPKSSTKQATQRIASEFNYIMKNQPDKQGYSVEPINDNMYHWELKLFNFDSKEPIGQDLAKMKKDHILLHITFPATYPMNPPFIRVIRPRFAFRTGHVTIGGSICTEMLTNKGWTPANTVEAVIISIRANLLEGGARLDTSNKRDYTEAEAKDAFDRMVQTHGWQ